MAWASDDNLPHVFNIPSTAFQNAEWHCYNAQYHHISHVETLFKIKNKGAAGQ